MSRVDKKVDDALLARTSDPAYQGLTPDPLIGTIGVANESAAFERAARALADPRFAELLARGAQPQRLLWASTGSKSSYHSDTHYVDALLAKGTVNTLPPATLDAFLEHGQLTPTLEARAAHYADLLRQLDARGIHLGQICEQLVAEGMQAFAASMEGLMAKLAARRDQLKATVGR